METDPGDLLWLYGTRVEQAPAFFWREHRSAEASTCGIRTAEAARYDDAERGANATLSIDLEKQEIRGPDGGVVKFDIDPHRKHCMLEGLDDIGLTKVKSDKIVSYEAKAKADRPWL